MDSSGVRTPEFSRSKSGFESVVPIFFITFCQIFQPIDSLGALGRTAGFWSGRTGFQSLLSHLFFWLHCLSPEIPMVPLAQWVRQLGFDAVSTSSDPNLFLQFELKKKRQKLHNTIPLLSMKSFDSRFVFETRKGSPTKLFSTVRQKISDRKSCFPPLMHQTFRNPKFFETRKGSPKVFLVLWDKKILDSESWYPPFMHKCFRYPKFFEATKGSSKSFFGTVRQKLFDGKSWYSLLPPSLCKIFFPHDKSFETQRGSPPKFFVTVRRKILDKRSWYPPLMHIKFRYPNFSKTPNGSPKIFLVLWDKKIPKETRDIPFSLLETFQNPEFFEILKGSRKFFWYSERKIVQRNGKSWHPLCCLKYRN